MSYDLEDVIEHYGVKGMKWGVRKDPDRVSARKQAKMEKKADKKWTKGMTKEKIHEAMSDADSRTKKQQEELVKRMSKSDVFKRAESGDRQAMVEFNFEWTKQYAKILNADMRQQAELKSPSGKKALEVLLVQYGDEPFMSPRIVKRDESGVVAMSYDLDDTIEHYGVKGMKWGVRKAGKSYMDASRKHEAKTKARRESQNAKLKAHKEREREYAKTVTKNAVQKVGKTVGKMNARRAEKQDAFHDKKMKSSKVYKSIYDSTPKYHSVNGRDRVRQRAAKAQYRGLQANVAMMVVGGTMAAASSKKGQKVIKTASNFVSSGQAQKIGKNVLNTVMGNPLRYVNAENMKNVVVDSGALGGR